MTPPALTRRPELVRRLIQADRQIGAGNLERAAELLAPPQVGALLAGQVLRRALEGCRHEVARQHGAMVAAFEDVAACPLPLLGTLAVAARGLLSRKRIDAALSCLGRLLLLAPVLPDALRSGLPPDDPARPELFRLVLASGGARDLARQMRYKRQLAEQYGPDDAALAYAILLCGGALADAIRLPVQPLRDYARQNADVHVEVAAQCLQTASPPRLLGAPAGSAVIGNGRTLFVSCLRQAVVGWRSSLIQLGDAVLYDHQGGEFAATPADLSCEALCFASDGAQATLMRVGAPMPDMDEAISLLGAGSYAFGHWITEFLCKFLLIDQGGHTPGAPVLTAWTCRCWWVACSV